MKKRLEQLFIENNNVLSKKQLLEFGCTKYEVKKLVDDGTLEHLQHGLYGFNNELKDEFYTFQQVSAIGEQTVQPRFEADVGILFHCATNCLVRRGKPPYTLCENPDRCPKRVSVREVEQVVVALSFRPYYTV